MRVCLAGCAGSDVPGWAEETKPPSPKAEGRQAGGGEAAAAQQGQGEEAGKEGGGQGKKGRKGRLKPLNCTQLYMWGGRDNGRVMHLPSIRHRYGRNITNEWLAGPVDVGCFALRGNTADWEKASEKRAREQRRREQLRIERELRAEEEEEAARQEAQQQQSPRQDPTVKTKSLLERLGLQQEPVVAAAPDPAAAGGEEQQAEETPGSSLPTLPGRVRFVMESEQGESEVGGEEANEQGGESAEEEELEPLLEEEDEEEEEVVVVEQQQAEKEEVGARPAVRMDEEAWLKTARGKRLRRDSRRVMRMMKTHNRHLNTKVRPRERASERTDTHVLQSATSKPADR